MQANGKCEFPVLVVEDNLVCRMWLERILQKRGYCVTAVENGEEALAQLKSRYFPIVITDWMMPVMDGLQLCREIRKTSFPGYVFIVLLTSRDSKDDIVSGLEAGADDYLAKPVHHAELDARLATGIRILELEGSLRSANEEIKKLSITDSLTGCHNRAYLDDMLPRELKRAARYQHPLSIIMCDIDHFKMINDVHGHVTGDRVLQGVAAVLGRTLRQGVDWIARYGGEEFMVILPEADAGAAHDIAERLRAELENAGPGELGTDVRVTASFGVAGIAGNTGAATLTGQDLIQQADLFLYQAKRSGRNRVAAGPLLAA
jgi:diguanylate cyclase (GGDEF)-like protein